MQYGSLSDDDSFPSSSILLTDAVSRLPPSSLPTSPHRHHVSGLPNDPPSTFTFTKVFDTTGTVYYTSDSAGSKKGLTGNTMAGVITVLRDLKDPNAVSKCHLLNGNGVNGVSESQWSEGGY